MKNSFITGLILTIMDTTVFGLCVDKGLSPVGIVGACYVALRLFSRDADKMLSSFDGFSDGIRNKLDELRQKVKEKKDEEIVDVDVVED